MGGWWKKRASLVLFQDLRRDGCPNFLSMEEQLYAWFRLRRIFFLVIGTSLLCLFIWILIQWGVAYQHMVEKQKAWDSYVKDHPIEPLLAIEKEYQKGVQELRLLGKGERQKHRQALYMVVLAPQGLQLTAIHFSKEGFVIDGRTIRQDVLASYINKLRVYMKGVDLRENSHQEGQGGLFMFRLEGREKGSSSTLASSAKKNSHRQ